MAGGVETTAVPRVRVVVDALRRRPLVGCVVASLLALGFGWRRFLGGEHSPFATDIAYYHHPMTQELMRAWSESRLALWTDGIYCGFPFFADPQVAAWYPGTLLVVWLGPHSGYVAFLFLHAVLAALGTAGLVRAHGGAWSAAFSAGLVLALSGYYAHETQHPGLFAILAWIPVWLLSTRAVFYRPTPGRVVGAALSIAMMIFAGTLQVLFGAAILYGFYVIGLVVDSLRGGAEAGSVGRGRDVLRALAATAAAQLLGLSLAAVVLLPAVAHLPHTARSLGMTYEFAALGSVHPAQLLGLFVGSAGALLARGVALDFDGASFYLGALTLPLALLGIIRARRALPIALAVACVLLGLLALGRHGPLHPLLYEWLPGAVGSLRGTGRALGPASVCLALLAGLGLHHASTAGASSDRLLGLLLVAALACHALVLLAVPLAPPAVFGAPAGTLGSALVLVAALGLWVLTRGRPTVLRQGLAVLVAVDLLAFGALDRVLAQTPAPPSAAEVAGAFPPFLDIARGFSGDRVLLQGFGPRNLPLLRELDGVGGYNPLVTLRYLDFVSLVNDARLHPREAIQRFVHGRQPRPREAALFDAAAVRFVVSGAPLADRGLRLVRQYPSLPGERRSARLYENERALPRAYLAYRTERADESETLEQLLGDTFDGRRTTIVEGTVQPLAGPAVIAPVSVVRERPEVLRFAIEPEHPAVLVVADAWYPGWRAWVDGEETPVLRVNGLFRGVSVPAGGREVEMRFEPWTFRVGAAISIAAAVGLLVLVAWAVVKSQFGAERASPSEVPGG